MIHTKEDLKRYLYADREAQPPHPNIILRHFDPVYRIKTLIRLCEYHFNLSSNSFYHKVAYYCRKLQLKRLEDRFCSEFAINVFDEGLVIWHPLILMLKLENIAAYLVALSLHRLITCAPQLGIMLS